MKKQLLPIYSKNKCMEATVIQRFTCQSAILYRVNLGVHSVVLYGAPFLFFQLLAYGSFALREVHRVGRELHSTRRAHVRRARTRSPRTRVRTQYTFVRENRRARVFSMDACTRTPANFSHKLEGTQVHTHDTHPPTSMHTTASAVLYNIEAAVRACLSDELNS